MAMVVAPLTNTLMGSVPGRNSGLGSAINNALSRVGQPLVGAVIFVAISASFYTSLANQVPGLDPSDPALRAAISPLNPPKTGTPPEQVAAAKRASVDAFHLAALVSAGLMAAGSLTSAVGLRSRGATKRAAEATGGSDSAEASSPSGGG
jgi:DHA2 family multidrug resistance protein-like MFS transporter